MRLTQFGTYTLPRGNKRDDISTGSAQSAVVVLPGGGSYDSYGTAQAPEAVTTLSTEYEIVETTAAAVQTARDAIRAYRGKRSRLWAETPSGLLRWVYARLARVRMEREIPNIYYQPVQLDFEIAEPGWNGMGHGAPWYLDAGEYLDSGLYLDYDELVTMDTPAGETVTVNNGGNRTVTDVIFTVTASGDQITAFTFTCSPCKWAYTGTIADGKSLVIDCGAKSVIYDGTTDGYADFALDATHASANWCEFVPGDNTVTLAMTTGSVAATVAISYHDGWE